MAGCVQIAAGLGDIWHVFDHRSSGFGQIRTGLGHIAVAFESMCWAGRVNLRVGLEGTRAGFGRNQGVFDHFGGGFNPSMEWCPMFVQVRQIYNHTRAMSDNN